MRRALLVFLAGLAAGSLFLGEENPVELFSLDLRFAAAAALAPEGEISDRVAIVLMDRGSEEALGQPSGVSWRRYHPSLVDTLLASGAALVVFDAEFAEESPEWDAALGSSFRASGRVVAGESFPGGTASSLRASFAAIGDLRIRSYYSVPRRVLPTATPPLCAAAARILAADGGSPAPELGPEGFWIDFREPPDYFPALPYAAVLGAREGRAADEARTPVSVFAGKAVLVGDAVGADRHPFPNSLGMKRPGVLGQAYALETLLESSPIAGPDALGRFLILAGAAALAVASSSAKRRWLRAAAGLGLPLAALAGGLILLASSGFWLPLAPILAAFSAAFLADRAARRRELSSRLAKAVGFDPALVEAFRAEAAKAGGILEREAAILVADVRGSTRFVSDAGPRVAARVMGEYLAAMERCVTAEGGYVNKFVGDEIVAVFGFPLAAEGCAERSLRAALAMLDSLEELKRAWEGEGLPQLAGMGVGLDYGPASFFEVGGRSKRQFDLVGDCINGASRIEAMTKELGEPLLVSGELLARLDERLRSGFRLKARASIRGQGERELYAR